MSESGTSDALLMDTKGGLYRIPLAAAAEYKLDEQQVQSLIREVQALDMDAAGVPVGLQRQWELQLARQDEVQGQDALVAATLATSLIVVATQIAMLVGDSKITSVFKPA